MSFLFPLIGWLIALFLAAAAVSALARPVRERRWKDAALWLTPLLYGCAATAALTGLGVLKVLTGAVLAVALGGVFAVVLLRGAGRALRNSRGRAVVWQLVAGHIAAGFRYLRDDVRGLLRGARNGPEPRRHEGPVTIPVAVPAPAPVRDVPAARDAPAAAGVPSVRDDPALGPAPTASDVAAGLASAGIPVPPEWAVLCDAVAAFEPDTDEDLMMHVAGEAAGVSAWAEAVRARADTLLHGIGLDPAYVAGHMELADEIADIASAVAMVDQRFAVIYGAIRDWVAEHPEGMPFRAREWLQGGGTGPVEDAGDEAA